MSTRFCRRAENERHGADPPHVMDKEGGNFKTYGISERESVANDRTPEPVERRTGWTSWRKGE